MVIDNGKILSEEFELNLSDFALFLSVMKNREAYECVLSIIMDEQDLELAEVKVEQVVLNKAGKRAIRLDAWALDKNNARQFNTEMQNDTQKDDVRKRSRYYQSLIDSPVLKSGEETKYKNLPSTIIIFITQEDIFKKDLAMYTFTEQCKEIPGLELDDGTKKIFLNMKSKNGRPELISLLQYMKNTQLDNPEICVKDNRIKRLDDIVTEVKNSQEWEAVRMSILDIGLQQGIQQGIQQGESIGEKKFLIKQICKKIIRKKSPEEICEELEEEYELVKRIYDTALNFAPDFDVDKIYETITKEI